MPASLRCLLALCLLSVAFASTATGQEPDGPAKKEAPTKKEEPTKKDGPATAAPTQPGSPASQPATPAAQPAAPGAQPTAGGSPDAAGGSAPAPSANNTSTDAESAAGAGSDQSNNGSSSPSSDSEAFWTLYYPLIVLVLGIAIVLGLIIGLKVNAFIALISAAMVVSLLAEGDISSKIGRVATAFGGTAGGIGIVIALAAVIGKCMLDSGAADRIVRAFVGVLGEKRAPWALMGSGYVLAVPVFFDTVFYLLVPLARSLHRRTGVQYLKYILAIAAGGALTHSLVPPTPGPLLMSSTLNVDLGVMILVGALVALPAAFAGVLFAHLADSIMKTPMRSIPGVEEPDPLPDSELPSLGMSLLPVLLPVLMISTNTVFTTLADLNPVARIQTEDIKDWRALRSKIASGSGEQAAPGAARIYESLPKNAQQLIAKEGELSAEEKQEVVTALNGLLTRKDFFDEDKFLGVRFSKPTKGILKQNATRMRRAVQERKNRLLLEDTLNAGGVEVLTPHKWDTQLRTIAGYTDLLGNANLALLISTVIAMSMLVKQRGLSRIEIAAVVEQSLMSGGVIILITAGGGAFGAMLQAAKIGGAIENLFGSLLQGGASGSMAYLVLGFAIAAVLKVAQGSGTVAMIVGSTMMAAIISGAELSYHRVYLATAIGAGSLVGSWMNDSGFWIFAKMGGLTEPEALKSWTAMLVVLGIVSFAVTLLLASVLPLV